MAIDLSGGLDEALGLVWAAPPDDPELRESVNAWIWDDGLEVAMPRIGIEAVEILIRAILLDDEDGDARREHGIELPGGQLAESAPLPLEIRRAAHAFNASLRRGCN